MDADPSSGRVQVSNDCPYINECDPDHGTPATTYKLFGAAGSASPSMSGFVEWEARRNNTAENYCDVMRGFAPGRLPVISALAREFALFDKFFCSHPGPTWPNRMFMLSGTSAGSTETGPWFQNKPGKSARGTRYVCYMTRVRCIAGQLFPQRTFFDQLTAAGRTWRNYYNDTPYARPNNLASPRNPPPPSPTFHRNRRARTHVSGYTDRDTPVLIPIESRKAGGRCSLRPSRTIRTTRGLSPNSSPMPQRALSTLKAQHAPYSGQNTA